MVLFPFKNNQNSLFGHIGKDRVISCSDLISITSPPFPQKQMTGHTGRFRYWLPKDLPPESELIPVIWVKRPNLVFGSTIPSFAGVIQLSPCL